MQMLLEGGDEFRVSAGLELVPGWVRKLPERPGIKLPSIGWNAMGPRQGTNWAGSLLENVPTGQEMYF